MSTPASGNRKRSFAATDSDSSSSRNANDTCVSSAKDQKKPGEDGDESGDGGSDTDGDGDEDLPDITNLRKALEYLVSVRDIESLYTSGESDEKHRPQTSNEAPSIRSETASASNNSANKEEPETRKEDPQLYMVPNLINRLLMEHYSFHYRRCDKEKHTERENDTAAGATGSNENATRSPSRIQREQMTQLLLAVIVEFSEPYFARMARHRQLERAKLLLMQQPQRQAQQQTQETATGRRKGRPQQNGNEEAPPSDPSRLLDFDRRAVSWATSCLTQLLRPNNGEGTSTSQSDGGERRHPTHIPELDALLAASGPHDGLEMERQMQSALLHGLQGRRRLQNTGM